MIRHKISKAELEALLEAEKPGWLARAQERTDHFAAIGKYEEESSIWSEIKVVFMRIQHGKCAYCERQLESEEYGRIEHDLEHFRPKKKARPWKLPKELKNSGIVLTKPISGSFDPGYHLLPYNPLNYCTSCKTCNSNLKNDYFPIEGVRSPGGNDPTTLGGEKPLLINPVGDYDEDPEDLITFHGLSPMAVGGSEYQKHRGLVIIAFFRLDDFRRKYLIRERANVIINLYSFLQNVEQAATTAAKETYGKLVVLYTKPTAPHTNCAASFVNLYRTDKDEAEELFQHAVEYISSISN